MKNPKLLLISALALLCSPTFAQTDTSIGIKLPTQKGSWMIGSNVFVSELAGTINPNVGMSGFYNVSLNPRAGYFVKDNLMVGGTLNATFGGNFFGNDYQKDLYRSQVLGLGVFGRKYFGNATRGDGQMNRLRFFVEGGASFNTGRASFWDSPESKRQVTFNTGTVYVMSGFNYFFTKNIALECGVDMSHTSSDNVIGSVNRVGVHLGLLIYLGKR